MNFKRLLNHMAPKKRFCRMAERTFRSILTKHYPDIKFHGEDPDDADLWVRCIGNWGVDRVLFDRDTGGVRMWRITKFWESLFDERGESIPSNLGLCFDFWRENDAWGLARKFEEAYSTLPDGATTK